MTRIAVVILNYNGEKLLQQFLPAVIRHSANASIMVVDNGSTDQSIPIISKAYPEVKVIALNNNYGFCGGYNRGLRQVDADLYVLLNSDIEVTPGWLDPMVRLFETNPTVAAVQPKILSWHQKDK